MSGSAPRLGFALNLSSRHRSPAEVQRVYEEVLEVIEHAEALGLDSVWIGQHHFDNTDGPVPSPLVLLAAAAQRTERIWLGTGITTLPFEDPIRLAEDAAVLDALAGGRLHLGLGTGGANLDGFRSFGLDPAQRHAIFASKVRQLHHALDGGSLVGIDGPRLYPPADGVRGRLWQAATSVDGAVAAARAGDGLQQGAFFDPADSGQRPKVRAYLDAWADAGHARPPRVAIFRFVYPGESRDAVERAVAPALGPRLSFLAERAALSGNPTLRGLSVREYLDRITKYGSPADVAEQLRTDPAIAGSASDIVANFAYGGEFDVDRARRDLTVLAEQIGPELGWRPTPSAQGTTHGSDQGSRTILPRTWPDSLSRCAATTSSRA